MDLGSCPFLGTQINWLAVPVTPWLITRPRTSRKVFVSAYPRKLWKARFAPTTSPCGEAKTMPSSSLRARV